MSDQNEHGEVHQTVPAASDPAGEGWLSTLLGHNIRIRTHGKETDNRVTIIEYIEKPHSSPPVFTRHEFVEIFYIRSGTLTFQFLDEEAFQAPAETVITVPGWKPHAFWNDHSDPVMVTLVCSPAGLDRFFEASHALLQRRPPDTADRDEMAAEMKALRDEYGLEPVAPAPMIKRWKTA